MFPLALQTLAWVPTRIFLRLVYGFRVYGTDHLAFIPKKSGVIFVANHTSTLDPILVTAALPPLSRFTPLHYGSREKDGYSSFPIGKYIYGGTFFRLWGAYPVYRGRKSYRESLVHHTRFLTTGQSVCYFPEGGIASPGTKLPVKPGVVYLTKYSGATLVPVKITITPDNKIELQFGHPFLLEEIEAQSAHLEMDTDTRNKLIAQKIMDRVYQIG